MSRACPKCGDPLSRERCNVTVPRQERAHPGPFPGWFYVCETCGSEFHGYDRPTLRLVPLSSVERWQYELSPDIEESREREVYGYV
jgi:hypothetical protein